MNNNSRTLDYADNNDIKTVETTSKANGYPANLRHVLTFDTITHLLKCYEELTAEGHTVTELMLHKRDGWELWARTKGSIEHGMFRTTSESEFSVNIDWLDTSEQVAFRVVCEGMDPETLGDIRRKLRIADDFAQEVKNILSAIEDRGNAEATIFYDPDQDYRINYWADNDTVGYSHDTHTYQVALMVDWKEAEDEDND